MADTPGTTLYDYQLVTRDLSDVLHVIQSQEPTFISLIGTGDSPAKSHRHEWIEQAIGPEQDVLSVAALVGDVKLTVANPGVFQEGLVLAFEGYDEVMVVTGPSVGNDVPVQRGYGGTTAVAMGNGTLVKIVSRPRVAGTGPGDDPSALPDSNFNFTEIFDHTAKVSRTAQNTQTHGIGNLLDFQVQAGARSLNRRMNRALIFGRRVEPTKTTPGSMGGLLYFLENGNRIAAAGAPVDPVMLNDAIEAGVARGGRPNVILCNTNQARKISAFNANKVQILRQDQTAGQVIYDFQSDLPMGIVTRVVVEPSFPRDKIALVTPSMIQMEPLQNSALRDMDATLPGADYVARRLLGEYTAEFYNAQQAHVLIEGLAQ